MLKRNILRWILCVVITMMMCIVMTGCDEEEPVEYGEEIGIVSGNIEFKDDEKPVINISNIKSYIGEEVDYLSRIVVSDPDKYDEMEIWVDASAVDIFTTGDYKAIYTFVFAGKEYSYEIVVTIIEKPEESGDDIVDIGDTEDITNDISSDKETSYESEETTKNEVTTTKKPSGGDSSKETTKNDKTTTVNSSTTKKDETTKKQESTTKDNPSKSTTTKYQGGSEKETTKDKTTSKPTTTSKQESTTKNNATTKNNSTTVNKTTTSSSNETTSRKQLVTTSGKVTTKFQELGYYSIELLSGKVVKIKCTTSKYIVSTRTDVSYTTKNGNNYKVSKLIVTYSTGDTQVLETVEEKMK